jgi:hypothetical protein
MQRPLREGAVTQQASCETAPIVPPPAQLSLFGFAVRADDLTTTSEPCPHCGATIAMPGPGRGPHFASLRCSRGHHLGWLPKPRRLA